MRLRQELSEPEVYRSTTAYPHPHVDHSPPDLEPPTSAGGLVSMGSTGALAAYMLPGSDGLRGCEIHMNSSFPHLPPGAGLGAGSGGIPQYGPPPPNLPWGCNWLLPLIACYRSHSLLSKFPSRAKRIDVISRFFFPLVFAVFNLAYWLYYLFAKSKSPQSE